MSSYRMRTHGSVVASLIVCLAGVATAAQPSAIAVDANRPTVKISPYLYGIFFEEINRAGDGGLYGEMLQNRSFEDADQPAAWTLVKSADAEGAMTLDVSQPLGAHNPHALKLEIARTGGGRLGVANEGFKGIAVRAGGQYALSFYARRDQAFSGPLRVSLEENDGRVLAAGKIATIGRQWKKYQCLLTAGGSSAKARLVIAAASTGAVWLDVVSLFPQPAWKDRPNGLRPDLAEMLLQMKPAFVRFPGGCYVEGNKLANAFRWKDSIGDIAERPGHWNLWGYRSNDGLGYHEYLQMCEDLGAEPLLVINCGMAHEDSVPMAKMDEWVGDALDAIEYANGPAGSKWGGERVKAGHAAPFHLKFMEIGNENGGPIYQDHYKLFYDAIKARYPKLQLVANCPTSQRPTEILDEHYYNNPEFFANSAHKYDAYPRSGPKIYVGEYAVTEHCGKGNLRAALGEAAFMTGMERNSDIVVMSSYAPLFVHAAWRQWNPDAIVFDAARVCGTPSYYVQKMFAANLGDVVLPSQVISPSAAPAAKGGAIGVGTWATQAEFKDLKVTQGDKILFQSDFAAGLSGLRPVSGTWQAKDGAARQTALATDVRAVAGDKSWTDYTYSLKARKLAGAEGFLILFNVRDEHAKSWWNVGGWGNSGHAVEMGGQMGQNVPGRIETGRWYDIRVETKGPNIRCYLDGKLIHDIRSQGVQALYAVASRQKNTGALILKVVNFSDSDQDTQIDLRHLSGAVRSGSACVLTAESPDAENTLDDPAKVVPVTRTLDNPSAHFRHTFPAHSATVLRLTVEP
ncbi:MAG: alpha-L-arabinofuranosidase C-terminal domain-containing protein [Thermoguttaceae bacterium]